MLALLTELEALTRAITRAVRINLDGMIANSDTSYLTNTSVKALATTRAVMLCLATATATVAHMVTFVVVVPTTAFVPFNQIHSYSSGLTLRKVL